MLHRSAGRPNRRFFIFPVIALAFVAVMSAIVMLIWNKVLVDVLPVKTVSYIQSVGIFVLCKILFGNFKRGGGQHFQRRMPWKDKIRNMSDEEREQFRAQWRERCKKR